VALPDGSYIIDDGKTAKVYGPAFLFENGEFEECKSKIGYANEGK
jgi:hypothetical protein